MGIRVAPFMLKLRVCFWVAEQASMRTSQQAHVNYLSCTQSCVHTEGTQKQLKIRGVQRIKGGVFME